MVLVQSTTTDIKMAGATQEMVVAKQEAISAVDEAIYKQVTGGSANNSFAKPISTYPKNLTNDLVQTNKGKDTTAEVGIVNNEFQLEADCPHSNTASSSQVFTCNVLEVKVSRQYGRNKASDVDVNAGIAQQLLR